MSTMEPNEIANNVIIKPKEGANLDTLSAEVDSILNSIKAEYLGRLITAELRNEIREEIGNRVRILPGVTEVLVTTPISGNPPMIRETFVADMNRGTITKTNTEIIEGRPVPRPRWTDKPEDD